MISDGFVLILLLKHCRAGDRKGHPFLVKCTTFPHVPYDEKAVERCRAQYFEITKNNLDWIPSNRETLDIPELQHRRDNEKRHQNSTRHDKHVFFAA